MTRINLVAPSTLYDQHLMAEYRELPMVMAAAARSNPVNYVPKIEYTLNAGHVLFFFNKKRFLQTRWNLLLDELKFRKFNIAPENRIVKWENLDKFEQTIWYPTPKDIRVSQDRINQRVKEKPKFYRYMGKYI